MKVLCDTSVLVSALIESHPMHSLAFPWLERAKGGEIELLASTHTLAELYAVLTGLPLQPKISPAMAHQLIDDVVQAPASLVELSVSDYVESLPEWPSSVLPGVWSTMLSLPGRRRSRELIGS